VEQTDPRGFPSDDVPTPPRGFEVHTGQFGTPAPEGAEDETPPAGISGLVGADGIVSEQDFGASGPAVLGGADPVQPGKDAGEWPTLEYRSRAKQRSGTFDWLRRRRDDG
jgi:hypothetical protein